MLRSITLQLTDETLNRAQEIANQSGKTLEETLAGWIDRTAASPVLEHIMLSDEEPVLSPNIQYALHSPVGGEKTAQQLWEYLQQSDLTDDYPPKVSS
jgi:hypothetical protein